MNTPTVTFTFHARRGNERASLQCQIDAAGFLPCPSGSVTYANLPDGTHTFSVSTTSGVAQQTFRVDTQPPFVVNVGVTGDFGWPDGGVSLFQGQSVQPVLDCLDNIDNTLVFLPPEQCHTNLTDDPGVGETSGLGHYTFTVSAVDDAGNTSNTRVGHSRSTSSPLTSR